ncbi:MAG TPA: chorismate mutase [Acetobacteraceae bacterium]
MSSTSSPLDMSPQASALTLPELRAELDRIDDAIHDLLMRRAAVVTQVAGTKGGVALRPGREAQIIRRLLARHEGALPAQVLPRIWRELIAACTSMQGSYVIAVCEADANAGFVPCAREHFGALTRLRVHRSAAQAIGDVSAGRAIAAVLPMPAEEEVPSAAWWTALLHHDEPRIHVVARLPFWAPRSEGAPRAQALVVAAIAPDPSGQDRSLIGLELKPETSRARLGAALAAAGFATGAVILRREGAVARALVDVEGLVADADPRLDALGEVLRRPVVLGAYGVPVGGENA